MISQATIDRIKKKRRKPEYYKVVQDLKERYNIVIFQQEFMELGKGSFGKCYLGKIRENPGETLEMEYFDDLIKNDQIIAVKVIPKTAKTKLNSELYVNQIKHLNQVKSDNTVKVYPFTLESQKNFYIVMEYCNNFTLYHLIESRNRLKKKFTLDEYIQILLDLVNGYKALKVAGIQHNDLKPQNILIKNKVFKIGDFGLSAKLSKGKEEVHCGTIIYAAPEKLNPLTEYYEIDHKADIFSLGLILYEVLFGKHAYFNKEKYDKCRHDYSLKMNKIPHKYTERQLKKLSYLEYLQQCSKEHLVPKNNLAPSGPKSAQLLNELQKMVLGMCSLDTKSRKSLEQITIHIKILGLNKQDRHKMFLDLEEISSSEIKFEIANMAKYAVSFIEAEQIRKSQAINGTQIVTVKRVENIRNRLEAAFELTKIMKKLKEEAFSRQESARQEVLQSEFQQLMVNYMYHVNLRQMKLFFEERNNMNEEEARVANREDFASLVKNLFENDAELFKEATIGLENYYSQIHRSKLKDFIQDRLRNWEINGENWVQTIAWVLLYQTIIIEETYQNDEAKSGIWKQLDKVRTKLRFLSSFDLSSQEILQGHKLLIQNEKNFTYFYGKEQI